MANNRNYKKSNGASIATIITLAVVTVLFVLLIGWGSNWFTDWTFSNVTDLVNSVFPSDDPDDFVDGDTTDGGTTDSGSTGGSSSDSGTTDSGSTGGSGSDSGTTDSGSTGGSTSTDNTDAKDTLSIGSYYWNEAEEWRTMTYPDSTNYTISASLNGGAVTVSSYTITLTDEAKEKFDEIQNPYGTLSGVYTITGSSGTFNLYQIIRGSLLYLYQNNAYQAWSVMNSLYNAGTPVIQITVNGSSDSAVFYLLVNPGTSDEFMSAM